MADFKKLEVWQKAHHLSLEIARTAQGFRGPLGSIIRNQLIRSSLSIAANLSEGSAKRSDREFARFVRIALGSTTETDNHLHVAIDSGLLDARDFERLMSQLNTVGKMLTGLEKRLNRDSENKASALPTANSKQPAPIASDIRLAVITLRKK